MIRSVLFVCLGNICRSPAAEGIFRDMVAAKGLDIRVDSAGTSDWHVGDPPYGPMQAAAKARGADLSALRGRQVTAEDFRRFDLIVAMDTDNRANLLRLRPDEGAPVRLLLDFAPETATEAAAVRRGSPRASPPGRRRRRPPTRLPCTGSGLAAIRRRLQDSGSRGSS